MEERTTELDGRVTAGRKGIPYDWQAVLALADAAPSAVTQTAENPVLVAL
jgi:hypothetical protein